MHKIKTEINKRIVKFLYFISKFLPERLAIILIYWLKTKKRLNLANPVTYNEKLQWYKLYYRDSLMTRCADKAAVDDYVRECGLGHILKERYGVYKNVEEIDFSALPEDCFLKCNHNSAGNYHWDRNKNIDVVQLKKKLSKMLKTNWYKIAREWAYKDIKPKIICEEYLKASSKDKFVDYRFYCFSGEPKLVFYATEICTENGEHAPGYIATLDAEFKPVSLITVFEPLPPEKVIKPDNFEDMLEYARILSKPFPQVRVDFFHVEGKIYFGELTFYPGSGTNNFKPEKWQRQMGDWFVLPPKK